MGYKIVKEPLPRKMSALEDPWAEPSDVSQSSMHFHCAFLSRDFLFVREVTALIDTISCDSSHSGVEVSRSVAIVLPLI